MDFTIATDRVLELFHFGLISFHNVCQVLLQGPHGQYQKWLGDETLFIIIYFFYIQFLLYYIIFHLILDCARSDIFGFTLIILHLPKLMIHIPPVLLGLSRNENLSPYIILIYIINLLVIWDWAPSKLPARMTHEMGHMPDGSYGKAYDPSVIFLVSFFPSSPYAFFPKTNCPLLTHSKSHPNLANCWELWKILLKYKNEHSLQVKYTSNTKVALVGKTRNKSPPHVRPINTCISKSLYFAFS